MSLFSSDSLPEWIDLDWPSTDRPFGLHLWPIFDRGFRLFRPYGPSEFEYVQHQTFGSGFLWCISMLVGYYVLIFGGQKFMQGREPLKLQTLFKIHNLTLTLVSLGLLLLFVEQMVPTLVNHGIFYSICNANGGWTPQLVTLYYLNYLTKYVELLDTVFLFLKKKPLKFLHTYHHGATALLCFTQMLGKTSVSWVVISLNLFVHVVMYWYYFQSARGIRVWWKEYVTMIQIIQFIIDLGFVFFAAYNYFSAKYRPSFPHYGSCNGEEFAALSGIFILSSYLFLFIIFYLSTYKRSTTSKPAARVRKQDPRAVGHSSALPEDSLKRVNRSQS